VEVSSDDVVAKSDNTEHHHVLDVGLNEWSLLVEGVIEMITEGDGI
jgi:hypothetical protein